MGRFFDKAGESLYMCFAESGQLSRVAERCRAAGTPRPRSVTTPCSSIPARRAA